MHNESPRLTSTHEAKLLLGCPGQRNSPSIYDLCKMHIINRRGKDADMFPNLEGLSLADRWDFIVAIPIAIAMIATSSATFPMTSAIVSLLLFGTD